MSLKKLTDINNNDIQVESAIKDAKGQSIHSTYQAKLTTTSVSDGTINKVIGFDTNGDIVKGAQSGGGMTNPMTTQGDIIIGGSSGTATRLGIGTNGQVLTSNGTTASWQSLSIPNVVQTLSTSIGTLDSTAWTNLKANHYAEIASPVFTGLDSTYEFVNINLSIGGNTQYVKLGKNTTNKYSGLFFIEESTNVYEITIYYNGSKVVLRCATVE